MLLSELDSGMKEVRALMDEIYLPVLPLFSADPQTVKAAEQMLSPAKDTASAAPVPVLSQDLPLNVQLVTLQATSNTELLVRLGHQFAVGEDSYLSSPVSLDLFALLSSYQPISAQEMSLSANQLKSEMLANKVQWPTSADVSANAAASHGIAASTTAGHKEEAPAPAAALVKPSLRRAAMAADSTYIVELAPMEIKTFVVQIAA